MIVRKIHILTRMMQKTGWSHGVAQRVLTMVLDEITEALSRGDDVHLVQFGMFRVLTEKGKGSRFGYDRVLKKRLYLGRGNYPNRAVVRFYATRTGRLEEALKKLLPKKGLFRKS